MSYEFLQHYWCFIISLLGALLVFLMFVQGANSMIFSLGKTDQERRMLINSTGRKWEFTFTTLVTFGGAFFASFPLFYSTSFGGAYWLWMLILFSFVLQAVSYEFQNKLGNFLGAKTFQCFLVFNGIVGPLLLGGAVATFFEGSNFIVVKENLVNSQLSIVNSQLEITPVISHWANASHGLDALLNPWVLVFGLAVLFLARTLGILYTMNNIDDEVIRTRGRYQLAGSATVFVVLFVAYLVHLLLKDGFAYDDSGTIFMEPNKYLHNALEMWYLTVVMLIGVVLVLYGILRELLSGSKFFTLHSIPDQWSPTRSLSLFTLPGIWPAGIGTVLTVTPLLLLSAWNHTAYYPSTADLQSSLTLENSCSSYFTLNTMFWVSLLVPFVLAYIVYAWRKIDSKKIDRAEIEADDHAY
ncbi:MAG: cytochrome d ubiquinol oxidase subunit II [Prevotella sp.]|nr:cytochrome d ubiquinol oxidase subunit II [Prevotella sp.]